MTVTQKTRLRLIANLPCVRGAKSPGHSGHRSTSRLCEVVESRLWTSHYRHIYFPITMPREENARVARQPSFIQAQVSCASTQAGQSDSGSLPAKFHWNRSSSGSHGTSSCGVEPDKNDSVHGSLLLGVVCLIGSGLGQWSGLSHRHCFGL